MLGDILMVLLVLWFVFEAVRAIRTGELHVKRSVIRRSDGPVAFYMTVGLLLFFAAAMLDMTIGLGLLQGLINLNL